MPTAPEHEAPPADVSRMTKVQKLAALLVILGPDAAAQVLKHLEEQELEVVSSEMARFTFISRELQAAILKEFTDVALEASTAVLGGLDFTRHTLEKSLGAFRASDILNRVAPARAPAAALGELAALPARDVFNLIKHEPPQVMALILGQLAPEKSSRILALLPPALRSQVVERLATLSPTPVEVVERVVQVLNERLGAKPTRALNRTGGIKAAAEVLNALDRDLSKELLAALESRNPELGQAIRKKMFTFEDLTLLDQQALQKVLREVEMRDLAVALKTASEKLKGLLLSCISKRAAETVKEEMSFMGSVKLKEVEAAQTRIIEVVRRLEGEGELEIGSPNPNSTSE